MGYRAAVFDLDGTLANTLEDLADSMNVTLASFGLPTHPLEPYRYYVGKGMLNLARSAAPEGTDEDVLVQIRDRMVDHYRHNWSHKTRPYDGIPDLLEQLKKRGLRLAVLSNKPDEFTKDMVEKFFPGTFEYVSGARDGVPIKPDPTAAAFIAQVFGLEPSNCLYFGDTNTDMKTGRAAGMFTVGVSWGFREVLELTEAGAQAIIDTPAEALRFLDTE